MNRKLSLLFSGFLSLGLVALACSPGETVVDTTGTGTGTAGTTGSGNTSGTAGTTGSGNTTGHAGTTGSGNTTGTAGTTGTGNTTGTAGTTGSAGRGGTTGTGNTTGSAGRGGTTGTGNTTGTAGPTGGGNTTGTAGTTGSAGATGTTCGASFAVQNDGFVTAPGSECWSGYASAGGDAGSTITPTSFMSCGASCMLKISGMVGPATMANSYAGYVYLGFNVGQASGGAAAATVTPTGSGIKVAYANSSAAGTLRVQLVGDAAGSIIWCYTVPSGATSPLMIPWASFTKACYNTPPGAAYNKDPLMSVQLNIPGESTGAKMVNLTLTSIAEY